MLPNKIIFDEVERGIAAGSEVRLRVKGWSMYPLLRSNKEVITLRPLREGEPRVGDAVLFRYRDAHILHRVESIKEGIYYMRGDGNIKLTESAEHADIVALLSQIEYANGCVLKTNGWIVRLYKMLWIPLRPQRPRLLRLLRRVWR